MRRSLSSRMRIWRFTQSTVMRHSRCRLAFTSLQVCCEVDVVVVVGDGGIDTFYSGHGCGKLLQETAEGEYNFDQKNPPISPLTDKPVTTWYKPGQTWGSVFGGLAGAYEVGGC